MRAINLALAAMVLLAACDRNKPATVAIGPSDKATGAPANATATPGSLAIDVPGFKAQVTLPSISLSGKDTDIDGIKLYPGTRLTGMKVAQAGGDNDGAAIMTYTADAPPAAVLAYYRSAAVSGGYQLGPSGTDSVSGTKGAKSHFTVVADAAGSGSEGTVTAAGD